MVSVHLSRFSLIWWKHFQGRKYWMIDLWETSHSNISLLLFLLWLRKWTFKSNIPPHANNITVLRKWTLSPNQTYMHAKSQSNAQAMFNLGYIHERWSERLHWPSSSSLLLYYDEVTVSWSIRLIHCQNSILN